MSHNAWTEVLPRILHRSLPAQTAAAGVALTSGGLHIDRPLRQRLFGAPRLRQVLSGKTVLVTGASSGIGRAVAHRVAEAGATTVLVARSEDTLRGLHRELVLGGGRVFSYPADLSIAASTDALLERLASDGLAIDVLINNAGRSIRRPLLEAAQRLHDYERTMALNYFGALRLILGLVRGMRSRKSGHIINVSSAGVQMGTPLFSAYVASKAALDAFSRVAATELGADGIRFSTVYMPLVRTRMIEPTREYRDAPALSPARAADLVLRPLITHEKHLGTRLASWISVGYALSPAMVERVLSFGQSLLNA